MELTETMRPNGMELPLYTLAKHIGLKQGDGVLEVGCFAGESTRVWLDVGANVRAVDPWRVDEKYVGDYWKFADQEFWDRIEAKFDERTAGCLGFCHKFKGTFEAYTKLCRTSGIMPSYKLVYIDALHDYHSVQRDILDGLAFTDQWIGGHDYHIEYKDGVVKAVDDIFGARNVALFEDNSWLTRL